jgi:Fusaric acid resistance protein-like
VHPLQWLERRDRDLAALRRAGRAAIVMPAMFALGEEVIADPVVATFAAFGAFSMLLLVDFGGPLRERLQAQAALALAGGVLVCLGTLVSRDVWLAVPTMALVGFAVLFLGVVSSVLAGARTSLLLSFILPVTIVGPVSSIPDRLAGWGLAGAAALGAVGVLWPAPRRSRLRDAANVACRTLAGALRAQAVFALRGGRGEELAGERDRALARSQEAVAAMHRVFLATSYHPASLSTAGRTTIRVVDELNWVSAIVAQSWLPVFAPRVRSACDVKVAAAAVLEHGAELLEAVGGDCAALHAAIVELREALLALQQDATSALPLAGADGAGAAVGGVDGTEVDRAGAGVVAAEWDRDELRAEALVSALDPSFRAQELGFAVRNIAQDIDLMAAAERRGWLARLLGRQPRGLAGTLTTAQRRAAAHVDRNSVWLHNSVRGAVGLALAVLVANRTGVQHSFWVVLGTLSVLRSNALNTGQNALRGLLGTVAGFVVGAGLLALIGTDRTLLWLLLPVAILLAGVAPAAISFAAGQAAFTLTLVFLYNIIRPSGWHVGLLRVEDIAIGCGVSLVVGLLFWPRGAGPALRRALADAYGASARYLAAAVDFGMRRCDSAAARSAAEPAREAERAAAAARRLDDTFRSYLAEGGAKPVPLAAVTTLLGGARGLRIAADAVLDLWEREDGSPTGDRAAARAELQRTSELMRDWYEDFGASLRDGGALREPLGRDAAADGRLVAAVSHDLHGADGAATGTAVRMIWTGDHLDAARRLQQLVLEPARGTPRRPARGRSSRGRLGARAG